MYYTYGIIKIQSYIVWYYQREHYIVIFQAFMSFCEHFWWIFFDDSHLSTIGSKNISKTNLSGIMHVEKYHCGFTFGISTSLLKCLILKFNLLNI